MIKASASALPKNKLAAKDRKLGFATALLQLAGIIITGDIVDGNAFAPPPSIHGAHLTFETIIYVLRSLCVLAFLLLCAAYAVQNSNETQG